MYTAAIIIFLKNIIFISHTIFNSHYYDYTQNGIYKSVQISKKKID